MQPQGFHHLTLTVTDAQRSAQWYQTLLGEATVIHREAPGWKRIRMQWPGGLVIGVTQHEATSRDDVFDCTRVGLDHIGITCADETEVQQWQAHMDAVGIHHGPLEDVPYGWAITARDPDDIAVEFFASKN